MCVLKKIMKLEDVPKPTKSSSMLAFAAAAAAVALMGQQLVGATSYCNFIEPPIPPCIDVSPRDLIFLVDGTVFSFLPPPPLS